MKISLCFAYEDVHLEAGHWKYCELLVGKENTVSLFYLFFLQGNYSGSLIPCWLSQRCNWKSSRRYFYWGLCSCCTSCSFRFIRWARLFLISRVCGVWILGFSGLKRKKETHEELQFNVLFTQWTKTNSPSFDFFRRLRFLNFGSFWKKLKYSKKPQNKFHISRHAKTVNAIVSLVPSLYVGSNNIGVYHWAQVGRGGQPLFIAWWKGGVGRGS